VKIEHGRMGLIIGSARPIVQVEQQPPVSDSPDTGIRLYCTDAPLPDVEPDDWFAIARPICIHCIAKSHPTIGRALSLAKRHGRAVFVDGAWRPSKGEFS
jgi:hypothetical protein